MADMDTEETIGTHTVMQMVLIAMEGTGTTIGIMVVMEDMEGITTTDIMVDMEDTEGITTTDIMVVMEWTIIMVGVMVATIIDMEDTTKHESRKSKHIM